MRKVYHKYIIAGLILLIAIMIIRKTYKYDFKESMQSYKKIAISFGGGGKNYYDAVTRITDEFKQLNLFDNVIKYTDDDLKQDEYFWETHGDFIKNNKRGYGYWVWKPYIILKTLEKMNDDDILLYLDAGCEIILKEDSGDKLNNMINNCYKYNILYTLPGHDEKSYTKMDIFKQMNIETENIMNSQQHQSGIIFIKKNALNIKFVQDWYNLCCNYHLLDDSQSISKNNATFIENRHDQSLFSLLSKTDKYKEKLDNPHNIIQDVNLYPIVISRKVYGN